MIKKSVESDQSDKKSAAVPTANKKKKQSGDSSTLCAVVLDKLTKSDISKLKGEKKIRFDEESIEKSRHAARPSSSTHESRYKSRQGSEYRRRRSSSHSSCSSVELEPRYRHHRRDYHHRRNHSHRYRQYSSDSSPDYYVKYSSRSRSRSRGHRHRRVSYSPSPDRRSRNRSSYRYRRESRSPSSDSTDGRKSRAKYRRDSSSPDSKRQRHVSSKVETPVKVTPKKRALKTTPVSTPRAKRNQTNAKKGNGRDENVKSPASAAIKPAKRATRSKSVVGEDSALFL